MLFKSKHPVALFCNGYGDSILALPTLRALARLFRGDWRLICHTDVYQILFREIAAVPIDTLFETKARSKAFNVGNIIDRVETCDLFMSLVPWRSEDICKLLAAWRPKTSIGFFPDYDVVLPLDFTKHTSELTFDLVRSLDPDQKLADYVAPPCLPARAIARADEILQRFPGGFKFLAVHADTLPDKMWPAERFRALLHRFLDDHPDFIALVLGVEDQALDQGSFAERIIPFHGLPLEVSMAMVQQANLFVGVDSCLLHVADFCRVPAVGLFGATNPDEFGFLLGPHRHVTAESMTNIHIEDVLAAMHHVLESTELVAQS